MWLLCISSALMLSNVGSNPARPPLHHLRFSLSFQTSAVQKQPSCEEGDEEGLKSLVPMKPLFNSETQDPLSGN